MLFEIFQSFSSARKASPAPVDKAQIVSAISLKRRELCEFVCTNSTSVLGDVGNYFPFVKKKALRLKKKFTTWW